MTQTELNTPQSHHQQDDDTIDIKKIIFRLLRNWYWFVLCVLVAGSVAFIYNRYTTPVYQVNSTILVEEDKVSAPSLGGGQVGSGNIFQGLGVMNSMRNIFNQIVILKSTPLVTKTLEELNFEVSYYAVGRVSVSEQYKQAPFQVVWEKDHPQIVGLEFDLQINPDGSMNVSLQGENVPVYNYQDNIVVQKLSEVNFSKEIQAGVKLVSDNFAFTILLNDKFNPSAPNNFKFRFNTLQTLIRKYQGSLNVTLPEEETSILSLTLREYHVQKGMDFLNKLTEIYQLDNLGKKNENANRTIQFISMQLQSISDSLNVSENRMETFQSENQVLDLSMQSKQLLEQMNDLDREKVELETQNKYYHYLKEYIENNRELETVIAPSAMGINDPLLNSLILQLNALITEKSSQTSMVSGSEHP